MNFPTLYFDAWKNDFTPEPLIAFIAEIDTSLKPLFKEVPAAQKILKKALGNVKALWRPAAGAVLQIAAKRATGLSAEDFSGIFNDIVESENKSGEKNENSKFDAKEDVLNVLKKIYDSSLRLHSNKKSAIAGFRNNLSLLIKALEKSQKFQLPIFIFIDELDRCRPDYAIELLEGIKHLFGVPGIYFIVATNMSQLGESTKAVYGPSFDGRRYLKRFFDIEYSLPIPNNDAFAKHLFSKATIPESIRFISGLERTSIAPDADLPSYLFAKYATFFDLSLRDQLQVMRVIEAVCLTRKTIHLHFLYFLAMLRHVDSHVFEKFISDKNFEFIGIKNIISKVSGSAGFFAINTYNPNRGHGSANDRQKKITIQLVIQVYLSNMEADAVHIRGQQADYFEFPQSLLLPLGEEAPNPYNSSNTYPVSIRDYPNQVRQAGHFS